MERLSDDEARARVRLLFSKRANEKKASARGDLIRQKPDTSTAGAAYSDRLRGRGALLDT